MAEENQAPGPEATEASSTESGRPESSGSSDKGDFEQRLRTDPEFAVSETKKLQSKLGQATGELRSLGDVRKVVEFLGNGDIAAGTEQLNQHLGTWAQVRRNPQLLKVVEAALSGKPVPASNGEDEDEEYLDPELRKVRSLAEGQGETIARLETRLAKTELQNQFSKFGHSELGQALSEEERGEFFDFLEKQFETWSGSSEGRRQLETLNADTLEILAMNHLRKDGKLFEVAGRVARAQTEDTARHSTGPEASVATHAGADIPEFKHARDAMRWARANPNRLPDVG